MKEELRLALHKNKKLYISIGIMLICFFGFSIPSWIQSADWGEIYRPSALEQSLGSIFFGSVMLLMPFCASFPYATSQVDELRTSYFRWKVMRMGVGRYAWQKATATMLSGACAVSIPFLIQLVIWHFIALPYNPQVYENHKIVFYHTVIWHNWDEIFFALPIYLWVFGGIFITSAIWAFFGLATSVWLPDKVLCAVIPVCIYHLWMGGFTDYILGIKLASPEALFNDGLTLEKLIQSIISYSVLLVVSGVLYWTGLRKRSLYE